MNPMVDIDLYPTFNINEYYEKYIEKKENITC